MTEVLSSLFGRKKVKAPPPPVPNTQGHDSDGFVVVGNSELPQQSYMIGDIRNNNVHPDNQRPGQSNDYETLFSFLRTSESAVGNDTSPLRPVRPAPPVPACQAQNSYGLRPTSVSDAPTPSYYLSNVPFQISKTYGGQDAITLKSQVSAALSQVKAPRISEFEYSFNTEREVIKEGNANCVRFG